MRKLLVVISVAAAMLAGMVGGASNGQAAQDEGGKGMVEPPATDVPLVGTEWRLTQVVEPSQSWDLPPEVDSVLRFDAEGRFSGRACNHFSGEVEIDGDTLRTWRVISTKMACSGPLDDVERAFAAVMGGGQTVRWAISNGELRLDVPDGHGLRYHVNQDASRARR